VCKLLNVKLTGNITDGVAFTTETRNQNLVVLFNESQTTIVGDESCDLFSVLDKLDTNALTDGRVRLLSLNTTVNKCLNYFQPTTDLL
jgi:hypothetical protein